MRQYSDLKPGMPIGVFDSGIGGLTVAREIMRQMPNEKIVYFGDTARVPYGSKSKETVTRYSRQIVRFLLDQKVKAVAIACNTASAYALPEIEKECPVPVIGVIRPGARTACSCTRNGRIGVIHGEMTSVTDTSYIITSDRFDIHERIDDSLNPYLEATNMLCYMLREPNKVVRLKEKLKRQFLRENPNIIENDYLNLAFEQAIVEVMKRIYDTAMEQTQKSMEKSFFRV